MVSTTSLSVSRYFKIKSLKQKGREILSVQGLCQTIYGKLYISLGTTLKTCAHCEQGDRIGSFVFFFFLKELGIRSGVGG